MLTVALALVSGVAVANIPCKGERSGDDRDSKPTENCFTETLQGPAMAFCGRRYGKVHSSQFEFCLFLFY